MRKARHKSNIVDLINKRFTIEKAGWGLPGPRDLMYTVEGHEGDENFISLALVAGE